MGSWHILIAWLLAASPATPLAAPAPPPVGASASPQVEAPASPPGVTAEVSPGELPEVSPGELPEVSPGASREVSPGELPEVSPPDAPAVPTVARDIGLSESVEIHGRLGAAKPGPAASSVEVVDASALEAAGARSVPEALARLASVNAVDQVGNGRQLSLDLRGFSGAEGATALVVDGIRVNDADTNLAAWESVRLEDVERVEISAGPRGAFVGGGSLAGVVNVIRRRPSETPAADIRARAGTFGFRDLSAVVTGPVGRWRFLASAGAFEDDGFRDDAGSRERSGRIAASRDIGPATLDLGWSALSGRWRHPGALKAAEIAADPSAAPFNALDVQETTQHFLTARTVVELDRTRVVAVAGFRDQALDILATGRSCYGFRTRDSQQSLSGSVEGESRAWKRGDASLSVRWGGEAARERLHPEGFATDETCDGEIHSEAESSAVDLDWDRIAAFAGVALRLRSGLGLEMSLRHDRSSVSRSGFEVSGLGRPEPVDGERDFDATTFRVGAGREHAARGGTIAWHAAWEQSFLPPSAIQLFAYPGFFSNPSLHAQRGSGPSAGLMLKTERAEVALDLYETRVTDEIAYDDASRSNVNAGSTRRRGAEARAAWTIRPGVRARIAHAITDASFRGGFPGGTRIRAGARVPLVPDRRTVAGLELGPWRGFAARLDIQRIGRAALSNDFDGTSPRLSPRTLVALSMTQQITAVPGLSLELSGDNLLDDRHPSRGIESWDDLYFTPPAPRRITLGVAWRFR